MQAPQWQQVSQVFVWQVLEQPVDVTVPRTQSWGEVHSQPLLHDPSQLMRPALQMQVPDEHVALLPQELPQKPQLVPLVSRLVSQPLLQAPSQLPQFGLHWQPPELHTALALQRLPHEPQLVASLPRR